MNQPKRDAPGPISISMKPALARKLMVMARERGQTRSAFVRDLVEKGLDRAGDGDQQDDQKG